MATKTYTLHLVGVDENVGGRVGGEEEVVDFHHDGQPGRVVCVQHVLLQTEHKGCPISLALI